MTIRRRVLAALVFAGCGGSPLGPAVDSVALSKSTVELRLGDTTTLTATALDETGAVIESATFRWSTNGSTTVLVGQRSGLVTAVGSGTTTITAEYEAKSADAIVSVTSDLVSVESGGFHTCGTTAAGRAACWGSNSAGKLGTGTLFSSLTPALVLGLTTTPVAVSAGGNFTCALDTAGAVFCWGSNSSGQLGMGVAGGPPRVMAVPVVGGASFVKIVAGDRHACGLTSGGEAYCWGGSAWGQLGVGTPSTNCALELCELQPRLIDNFVFSTITAGFQHTCGIVANGQAFCWGVNVSGTLGDSSTSQSSETPVPVSGGLTFQDIAGADDHTCGITTDGAAYCWGASGDGQLGDGTESLKRYPVRVSSSLVFESVTTGGNHSCARTAEGEVFCWGRNLEGELGNGSRDNATTPVPLNTTVRFTSISAGATHNCGMSTDGEAFCWGWNITGQLGVGSGRDRLIPAMVAGQ